MKKILIVDNEDGKFAQEILEADYDVTCVDSAEKAIEIFDCLSGTVFVWAL